MSAHRSRHSGFVLIFTLLVLMVAAVALAASARHTIRQSLDAKRAVQEVQDHWTTLTAQRALLPHAEKALAEQDEAFSTTRPIPPYGCAERRIALQLNSRRALLVFTDEQAKLNVNALYTRLGLEPTAQAIKRLSLSGWQRGTATQVSLRATLAPSAARYGSDEFAPILGSYGQVWDPVRPEQLVGTIETLKEEEMGWWSYRVTCWGDGRVHLRRASREALIEALRGSETSGLADSLVRLRADDPDLTIPQAAQALQLTQRRRATLEQLLTDGSTCYGLWVITSDDRRHRYSLAISDHRDGYRPKTTRWVWP